MTGPDVSAQELRKISLFSAMNYLENLDATPETAAHWRTLAKLSLDQLRIPIAQRCYAELGDIAKARYLKVGWTDLNQTAEKWIYRLKEKVNLAIGTFGLSYIWLFQTAERSSGSFML